jgi:hypothetical protein
MPAITEHPAAQSVSDSTPHNDFLWFAATARRLGDSSRVPTAVKLRVGRRLAPRHSGKSARLHHNLADFLDLLAAHIDHRSHDVVDQVLPMWIDRTHDLVLFTREGPEEIGEHGLPLLWIGLVRTPG